MKRILLSMTAIGSMAAAAIAGGIYGKTVFYDDVSVGSWNAISNVAWSTGSGGTYTNPIAYTNYYRLCGTNLKGRIPLSTNVVAIFEGGTNGTNSVRLAWPRYNGVAAYVLDRSYNAGATWTNWLILGPAYTNWTDTGTNTWTAGTWTNGIALIPAPTTAWGDPVQRSGDTMTGPLDMQTNTLYADTISQTNIGEQLRILASDIAAFLANHYYLKSTNGDEIAYFDLRTLPSHTNRDHTINGNLYLYGEGYTYDDAKLELRPVLNGEDYDTLTNLIFQVPGGSATNASLLTYGSTQMVGSVALDTGDFSFDGTTLHTIKLGTGISGATATQIAETVVGAYTGVIASAVQPTDPTYTNLQALAAGAYPASNPSNYITLADVPAGGTTTDLTAQAVATWASNEVVAVKATTNNYVKKTGDTMSGNLTQTGTAMRIVQYDETDTVGATGGIMFSNRTAEAGIRFDSTAGYGEMAVIVRATTNGVPFDVMTAGYSYGAAIHLGRSTAPAVSNAYNLGNALFPWRAGYFGTVYGDASGLTGNAPLATLTDALAQASQIIPVSGLAPGETNYYASANGDGLPPTWKPLPSSSGGVTNNSVYSDAIQPLAVTTQKMSEAADAAYRNPAGTIVTNGYYKLNAWTNGTTGWFDGVLNGSNGVYITKSGTNYWITFP